MFVRYSIVLECYREVYRDYNVRAVHQTHEWWPYTIINSLAIKMEDGIFVENLRSITAFPFPWFFCGFADLVFSWGQYHDGFFHAHNFSYKYLVQTGMVEGDGLDETESYRAKSIRSELDPSVKFVITLFDSSHGSNAPYSTSSMIYFYKNLLSLVLEKNDWGVIIKPKNDSYFNVITLNDDFNTIKKILIKQGRCVKLPASISPSVASMAGEITVCYGINSAGIISYLNGGPPTLHFDMNGNLEHPLYYVGGKDRVIFRSFDKVCYALEEIRNGDTKLGNHSEWIGLFDAFLDGKGRYRTGEIIGMYMKYRENGLGRDSALKKAIENYTLKWGHEKVSTPMAKQEHIGNELWYRVMEKTML